MPTAKDVQGEAKAQLVLFGPPAGQFEKGPMLVLRGSSVEETVTLAAEFFDNDNIIDDLREVFAIDRSVKKASETISKAFDATEETPREGSPPAHVDPTPQGGETPAEKTGYNQPCKNCDQPRTRGPLTGKFGEWYGCNTKGCKLGPR